MALLAGFVGAFQHRREGGLTIEGGGAEGGRRGDQRVGGVADHGHALAVGVRPARQAAALGGVGEQRADHLARSLRDEDREQLDLRAVGVPAGEVGVLDAALRLMQQAVHADVSAADVAEGARRQEGVVERGVEGVDVAPRSALDPDPAQRLVPGALGPTPHLVEAEARVFSGEVGAGVFDADERDADSRA